MFEDPIMQEVILERFATAGERDDRVVAAFVGGSVARGAADEWSDLDIYVIVGDEDGVLVVPRQLADEVARDAAEQEAIEDFVLTKIRAGAELTGTYPPDDATRAEFDRWRAEQGQA